MIESIVRSIGIALSLLLLFADTADARSDNDKIEKEKYRKISSSDAHNGDRTETNNKPLKTSEEQAVCSKEPMSVDGIVRLSKIEVCPEYLDEYMRYAVEVGEISLRTEPGVLTMYAVADKENPCRITILETYSSREAYKAHIASEHFQRYKQGTLHMVKSLVLSDQTPLNPANRSINFVE